MPEEELKMTNAEDERSELEQMANQANNIKQQVIQFRQWKYQQAADLRAKAELMVEYPDVEMEVYGETDPEELQNVADLIDSISL